MVCLAMAWEAGTGHTSRSGSLRSRTLSPLPGRVPRPVPLRPSIPRLPLEQPAHPSAHPHRPVRHIVLHRLACRHVGTLTDLDARNDGATPDLGPCAHRGRHSLPRQPGAIQQLDPGSQLGPRAHAAVGADVAAWAENGVDADDRPLEDAAAPPATPGTPTPPPTRGWIAGPEVSLAHHREDLPIWVGVIISINTTHIEILW